jgi:hypothetical protein
MEQISHHAYHSLPEDHMRRETGKSFADDVEHPEIKIQLLLGREKTMNKAFGQGLEPQAVILTARLHKRRPRT